MKCRTSESWNYTRYNDIIKAAELIGIPIKQAFAMRHNFIDSEVSKFTAVIADNLDYMLACEDEMEFRIYLESTVNAMKRIKKLESSRPKKPTEGAINDSDIEQARAFPVDQLIDFKRGKSIAFCHPDKNPSLFHGFRNNVAVCPVCDRKFGAIDILMERDGYSFIDAVKQLIGG